VRRSDQGLYAVLKVLAGPRPSDPEKGQSADCFRRKNPRIGLWPKNDLGVVSASFDVERPLGEAAKLTGGRLPLKTGQHDRR
jgi:hypothetical protein